MAATDRHPGEGRGPGKIKKTWIPDFAGMTWGNLNWDANEGWGSFICAGARG
jgi:hypothetical protein